jgi:hypothetical protein
MSNDLGKKEKLQNMSSEQKIKNHQILQAKKKTLSHIQYY